MVSTPLAEPGGITMPTATTEGRHADAARLDASDPLAAAAALAEAQIAAAACLRPALPGLVRAAEVVAGALSGGLRAAYAGAGSSGVMALSDALELAGTFGLAPDRTPVLLAGGAATLLHMTGAVEDDSAAAEAAAAALALGAGEALIAVSASGTTPWTCTIARAARAGGACVIGIANRADAPLLGLAEIPVLLDTGPELLAGSTRLGAATAQKIALNTLSTLAALHLGHVHAGHMVNLVADNAKLAARAARIVAEIAGCTPNAATAALAASDGAVKPAILVATGAAPAHARALLAAAGGHLGPALAALEAQTTPARQGAATGRPI